MRTVLWILPVLGLVSSFETAVAVAEYADSLHAPIEEYHRDRRSPDPDPYKGSVGGGSGFKLPPGVTPFNPKPQWPDAYNKRPRRSPQPGNSGPPPFRPPPNWRPPIRPIPRDPGRPWLQRRRRSPEVHIIRPVYIYKPPPTPPPKLVRV